MDSEVDEAMVAYTWKMGSPVKYEYRKLTNGAFERNAFLSGFDARWLPWEFKSVDYWEFVPDSLPDYVAEDLNRDRLSRGLEPLPTKADFDASIVMKHRDSDREYRFLKSGEWVVKDHSAGGGPPKPVDFSRWDRTDTVRGTGFIEEMIPAINADRERRGVELKMITQAEADERSRSMAAVRKQEFDRLHLAVVAKRWREIGIPKALGFNEHNNREKALREFIEDVLMDRGLIPRPAQDENADEIPPKSIFD